MTFFLEKEAIYTIMSGVKQCVCVFVAHFLLFIVVYLLHY